MARLTGPIAQPITLRSSPNEGNLESTISEISKIVRAKIMEFARTSGLTVSVRQYEQTLLWNSTISRGWFTEGLAQGSLLLCDLIRIGEEIRFTINHYFKTYNMTLYEDKVSLKELKDNRLDSLRYSR